MTIEIEVLRSDDIPVLVLQGRLDANGASSLEGAITGCIAGAKGGLVLDLAKVTYLSSAGMRVLLVVEKRLSGSGASLHLAAVGEYPLRVLSMAGFTNLIPVHTTRDEAVAACRRAHSLITGVQQIQSPCIVELGSVCYTLTPITDCSTELLVTGDIRRVLTAEVTAETLYQHEVSRGEYALGIGAPGSSRDECLEILGGMVTISGAVISAPTDGSDRPDTLLPVHSGGGATVHAAWNVGLHGSFQVQVLVEASEPEGIEIDEILRFLASYGKKSGLGDLIALAYIADLHSLAAETLLCPPLLTRQPENREPITHPSNFSQWIRTDNCPATDGELLVGFGIFLDTSGHPVANGDQYLSRIFPHSGTSKTRILHASILHGFTTLASPWDTGSSLEDLVQRALHEGECTGMHRILGTTRVHRALLGVSWPSTVREESNLTIRINGECLTWHEGYAALTRALNPGAAEVVLLPISGGYSGTLVFKVTATDRAGRTEMPFVLKMGPWPTIADEIYGYEEHVKRFIQNNATQVIAHARVADLGGILYTFVGISGPDAQIVSLEEYYLTHPTDEVLTAIDTLFRVALSPWYGQPVLREVALYREYHTIYALDKIREYAGENFGAFGDRREIELPLGLGRSTDPLYFIDKIMAGRERDLVRIYTSPVHGDLNLKNVLMDGRGNMWMIDFAKTRVSHNLQDIAKIEAVLKAEMTSIQTADDVRTMAQFDRVQFGVLGISKFPELSDVSLTPDKERTFSAVKRLRYYADLLTLLEDEITPYHLALFFYTLPVLAYGSVGEYGKMYAWISASMLAERMSGNEFPADNSVP